MIPILWFFLGFGMLAFGIKELIMYTGPLELALNGLGLGAIPGVTVALGSAALVRRSLKQASHYASMNAILGGFALKFAGAAAVGIAAFVWRDSTGGLRFDPTIAACTFLSPVLFGFAWQAYFVEAHAARERAEKAEKASHKADSASASGPDSKPATSE